MAEAGGVAPSGELFLDDDKVWAALEVLDGARRRHYAATGKFRRLGAIEPIERARRYLARIPPAVSGKAGRKQLWHAVLSTVRGFDLHPRDAESLLLAWNGSNVPPFSEREVVATAWRCYREEGNYRYLRGPGKENPRQSRSPERGYLMQRR